MASVLSVSSIVAAPAAATGDFDLEALCERFVQRYEAHVTPTTVTSQTNYRIRLVRHWYFEHLRRKAAKVYEFCDHFLMDHDNNPSPEYAGHRVVYISWIDFDEFDDLFDRD